MRPWRLEDAPALYELARDERIGRAADWPPHRNVDDSRLVIQTLFSNEETYAVELRESQRLVGCIGLLCGSSSHLNLPDDEAEAGYWLGVPYWGNGLIPEALEALLAHAFNERQLTAVWCCSFTDNAASRRVWEKCGFHYLRTEGPEKGWTKAVFVSRRLNRQSTKNQITLRPATEADIPLIGHMAAEAFPATYREILTPEQIDYMMTWMYSEESLRRQFREGQRWFLAMVGTEAAGYVSIERQEEALFHLQKIYVLPAFQGYGVGEALFRQAVACIRTIHPSPCRMELNVNRHNRALGFYQRMGMTKLREGDFPIGNGYFMNDFIMGLDIK